LLTGTGYPITPGSTITITIGSGGVGGTSSSNGSNSSFGNIVTIGGGYGNGWPLPGGAGGSSGGTPGTSTGAPVAGQGNTGGYSDAYTGAGGGGAGSAAAVVSNYKIGNGGAGLISTITGSPVQYAGGGGGSGSYYWYGIGLGAGGGGNGGLRASVPNGGTFSATSGMPNTGGGGGGGGTNGIDLMPGGSGGSGIVVLRYPSILAPATATTGSPNTYISLGYRIYIFNASGTITF
jgi:hypothetical protein